MKLVRTRIRCGNAQDIGTRKRQEDSFAFSDAANEITVKRGGILAVVADGMGGLNNGDKASTIAVSTFMKQYWQVVTEHTIEQSLRTALSAANEAVCDLANRSAGPDSAGTTLLAAVLHGDTLYWISVGDSRLYIRHESRLTQLSTDHVFSADLDKAVLQGRVEREIAETHPEREALTSCLGMAKLTRVDSGIRRNIEPGDVILLCTDGLYKSVTKEAISASLSPADGSAADRLLDRLRRTPHPRQDNVTILTMEMYEHRVKLTSRAMYGLVALLVVAVSATMLTYMTSEDASIDKPVIRANQMADTDSPEHVTMRASIAKLDSANSLLEEARKTAQEIESELSAADNKLQNARDILSTTKKSLEALLSSNAHIKKLHTTADSAIKTAEKAIRRAGYHGNAKSNLNAIRAEIDSIASNITSIRRHALESTGQRGEGQSKANSKASKNPFDLAGDADACMQQAASIISKLDTIEKRRVKRSADVKDALNHTRVAKQAQEKVAEAVSQASTL